jgi:hypothetical protein
MSSRLLLCAVVAAIAMTSCAALNVSVTCSNTISGTLTRYTDLSPCAQDCERDFCQCIGGKYASNACTGIPVKNTTTTNVPTDELTVGCARTQKCTRNRIWCINSFAWTYGVTPTPGVTPKPGTPAPPTPQPPTPTPPTPVPPTPAPTPVPAGVTPRPPTPQPPTPAPPTPAPPTPVPPPTPQPLTMQPTWGPPSSGCITAARSLQVDLQALQVTTVTYTGTTPEASCKNLICNDPLSTAIPTFTKKYCSEAAFTITSVCKKDSTFVPNEPTIEAELKLDATGINAAYALDQRAVYRALVTDMASYLDVDPWFIKIVKLGTGSLIVKYNVYGGTVNGLTTLVNAITTAGAFQSLSRVIDPVTPPTVTVAVTKVGEHEKSHDCRHNTGCVVGIILGCFGFVFIVVAIVVIMKMTSDDEAKTEPTNEEEEAAKEE